MRGVIMIVFIGLLASSLWLMGSDAEVDAPILGKSYPDIQGIDQGGQVVKLSSFKGSVVLVELIGMTCAGCQGFVGGNRVGGYGGITPQKDLKSVEDYFPVYTPGLSLKDSGVVYVQVLCYSLTLKAPTPEDVKKWAEHFKVDRSKNHIVIAASPELFGKDTFGMIPGFHLVDKNFNFAADSAGHHPKQNFFTDLLPMIPKLLKNYP